jgi:Cu2+-exporting ATPase
VRLNEAAETRRGRFVVLADRWRGGGPAVHLLRADSCGGSSDRCSAGQRRLTASAVLIITRPCALALAVPAVQVIATSRLFRGGMLLKSPTALSD